MQKTAEMQVSKGGTCTCVEALKGHTHLCERWAGAGAGSPPGTMQRARRPRKSPGCISAVQRTNWWWLGQHICGAAHRSIAVGAMRLHICGAAHWLIGDESPGHAQQASQLLFKAPRGDGQQPW